MALGLPSRMPGGALTVRDLIAAGERSFSFEFFPPKDLDGEKQLWKALRELEVLNPTFVSVTYGAGGSTRDRTVGITERIAQDTSMTPLAHLTCVDHSVRTLRSVIGSYAGAGVRNVLALRGDPAGGPSAPYVPHPEGLRYAVELVALTKSLGDFCVGVAAFPEAHPSAVSPESDARVLAEKARAADPAASTPDAHPARASLTDDERCRTETCTRSVSGTPDAVPWPTVVTVVGGSGATAGSGISRPPCAARRRSRAWPWSG